MFRLGHVYIRDRIRVLVRIRVIDSINMSHDHFWTSDLVGALLALLIYVYKYMFLVKPQYNH